MFVARGLRCRDAFRSTWGTCARGADRAAAFRAASALRVLVTLNAGRARARSCKSTYGLPEVMRSAEGLRAPDFFLPLYLGGQLSPGRGDMPQDVLLVEHEQGHTRVRGPIPIEPRLAAPRAVLSLEQHIYLMRYHLSQYAGNREGSSSSVAEHVLPRSVSASELRLRGRGSKI